jgi:uncharacterized protein (TIRG00374 family)
MKWKIAIGALLSALFLWLAFRNANLAEVARAVRSANYLWMIPMVAITLVSFALRAWRWRYLFPGEKPAFGPLFQSTLIGFMGNNVLPARLGEFMRIYAIGQSAGISRSVALGSIVVERILDMSMLLLLFAIVMAAGRLPQEVRSWGLYLLAFAGPILIGVMIFRAYAERILPKLERFLPLVIRARVLRMASNFREGLGVLGRPSDLARATLLSLLMWASLVFVVVCGFRSLDLHLPGDAGGIVLVVMAIGTMIPSAPGFIGTLQYAGVLALRQYGVDHSVALSFTLIYHASQWFPVTALGFYYFIRQHMSLKRMVSPGSGEREPTPITWGKHGA